MNKEENVGSSAMSSCHDHDLTSKPSRKIEWLINFLGICLIFYGVKCLICISDYAKYTFLFKHLPADVVRLRHLVSMSNRLIWLIVGIGILARREILRRILIILCLLTIATIYWKHPLACFMNIAEVMQANGIMPKAYLSDPSKFAAMLMYYNYWLDIGFSIILIYLFTRKNVRAAFR